MYITNISLIEIQESLISEKNRLPSFFYTEDNSCILIRLKNPGYSYPEGETEILLEYYFEEVRVIEIEDSDNIDDNSVSEIASILCSAKEKNQNIIVHCHAGISRSGAVVEVATMMGYEDIGRHRNPNRVLKEKLRKVLGIKYSFEE